MQLRSALLAATVLATPIAASAQPVTGLYVGLGAGVNIMAQEDIKNLFSPTFGGTGFAATGHTKGGNVGFAGVVSVGWGFGNGLRAEVEGNYRDNHLDSFGGTAVGFNGGTNEQKYGGMANVLYDFNGLTPWFVPYLGVGVGWEGISEKWHANNTFPVATAAGRFPVGAIGVAGGPNTQSSFAYQAIVGAAVPLPMITPGLAFTAEYRFMGTTNNRSYKGTATAVGVGSTPATLTLGPTFNNTVLLGLRYNFGVAPPPPPAPAAVPAQAPARSYLVFFDWDKATLTDRARQIIREAADNSTKVQYTRIEVNGYTDTSGTPRYNQGLSVRRARAVQAELVKDGVPANAITIQGFGDTHLLVPTGPGVREPQNRRVEIIIR
jgi:outer membrane protein OmpA-like peptidoglycan-associated protein